MIRRYRFRLASLLRDLANRIEPPTRTVYVKITADTSRLEEALRRSGEVTVRRRPTALDGSLG